MPPHASTHFARKVARENSSNDRVPSWFASSWSKILRASTSCDVVPLPDAAVFPDASLDVPPDADEDGDAPAGADGDALVVDGAVDGAGVAAVVADVSGDRVDCASFVADALDDVAAAGSDVVAHAAPASAMKAAAHAVASFPDEEFIAILLSLGGRPMAAGERG